MPPPGRMIIRPFAFSIKTSSFLAPSIAVFSFPEVSILVNPHSIISSTACSELSISSKETADEIEIKNILSAF